MAKTKTGDASEPVNARCSSCNKNEKAKPGAKCSQCGGEMVPTNRG